MKISSKARTTLLATLAGTSPFRKIRLTDFSIGIQGKKIVLRSGDEFTNTFQAITGSVDGSTVVITMTDAGPLLLLVKQDGSIKHGLQTNPETRIATKVLFADKFITAEDMGEVPIDIHVRTMLDTFFSNTTAESDSGNGLMIGDTRIMFIQSIEIVRHLNKGLEPMFFANISELLLLFTSVDESELLTTA